MRGMKASVIYTMCGPVSPIIPPGSLCAQCSARGIRNHPARLNERLIKQVAVTNAHLQTVLLGGLHDSIAVSHCKCHRLLHENVATVSHSFDRQTRMGLRGRTDVHEVWFLTAQHFCDIAVNARNAESGCHLLRSGNV